jgi:hypothetical protein
MLSVQLIQCSTITATTHSAIVIAATSTVITHPFAWFPISAPLSQSDRLCLLDD